MEVIILDVPMNKSYPEAGILSHKWGVSAAQDRVWAQVSGLCPSVSGKRLFMVLQAFIDESYNPDGIFVMGGYISSAEAWANFSMEWEEMLPYGTRKKNGKFHFKMSEMALSADGMERVQPFFRIIENHVLGFVSAKIDISDLRRVQSRIHVPGIEIDWAKYGSPYFIAFRCLIDMFHIHRPNMADAFPLDQQIDFYFDNHVDKGAIIAMWENYINERPEEIKPYYGATPRFEDDEKFLPLQAADFWAWWVRKWYLEGTPEKILRPDFGTFGLRGRGFSSVSLVSFYRKEK